MDKIVQCPGLNPEQLLSLKALSYKAKASDHEFPPLYWHLIQKERQTEGDLLYFKGHQNLVGYLGYFLFEENTAEITAVVNPDYRTQGIFSEMLDYAYAHLSLENIDRVRLRTPSSVLSTKKTLMSLNASYENAEYNFVLNREPSVLAEKQVKLVEVCDNQLDEVLSVICDGMYIQNELPLIKAYFKDILQEENRKAVLGYHGHEPCAKIHARFESDCIVLHDICFTGGCSPAYRLDFILQSHQYFRRFSDQPFSVLLSEEQCGLIQLFSQAGFKINHACEYWSLPFTDHERTVLTTKKLIN